MASLCRSSHLSREPVPRVDHGKSYTITSMGLPCLHQFSSWVLRSERKKGLSQKLHPSDWIVSTSQPNQHFHNDRKLFPKNNHELYRARLNSAHSTFKKDPGRVRQNSLATTGTNFTKPGAQNKVYPCITGIFYPTVAWQSSIYHLFPHLRRYNLMFCSKFQVMCDDEAFFLHY